MSFSDTIRSTWKRLDLGVTLALGWLIFAVSISVWLGPQLGMRGLAWMGIHHLLCLVGSTHELRRGWLRRESRRVDRE